MPMATELTKKDLADLQAYQAAIHEWSGREPQGADRYAPFVWKELQAWENMTEEEREAAKAADADLPPPKSWKELGYSSFKEYAEDPKRWKSQGSIFSPAWDAWNAEGLALHKRYMPMEARMVVIS